MVFDAAVPLRSGIVLANEKDESRDFQPRLSAEEILKLTLSADLILLSGCVSGISVRKLGDELLGLCRAWLYAGAASILASLWPTDDLASAVLMTRFIAELGPGTTTPSRPITKAEALRRAQLYVRNLSIAEVEMWQEARHRAGFDLPASQPPVGQNTGRPFANPYYWAPFVLIGSYR
jgi:CHAT domain-containing protein